MENEENFSFLFDSENEKISTPSLQTEEQDEDLSYLFEEDKSIEEPSLETTDVVDTEEDLSYLFAEDNIPITLPQDNELEDFTSPRSFEEFTKDRGYMDSIEEYSISRYGKDGAQQEDETDEEYLERFLTHVRGFETNSLSLLSTLDYVRGATEEEKGNFAYVYSQLERMPGFLVEGG